jgi:hypothetical protein
MYFLLKLVNQRDNAGAFDRNGEHFLVIKASPGDSTRHYFAFFGLEFAQGFGVFEVNIVDFRLAKTAILRLRRRSAATLSLRLHHSDTFRYNANLAILC